MLWSMFYRRLGIMVERSRYVCVKLGAALGHRSIIESFDQGTISGETTAGWEGEGSCVCPPRGDVYPPIMSTSKIANFTVIGATERFVADLQVVVVRGS